MNETVTLNAVDTPIGRLLVGATETGVAWVGFKDTPGTRARATKRIGLPVVDDNDRTESVMEKLTAYFKGETLAFEAPIDWRLTTDVQRKVLTTLYEQIPYGKVVTYGDLGELSGTGVHAQVIGQVMGSNPIPIIVPCHRVVASNGLGGYSGGNGIEMKRWLLTLEGSIPATLDWNPDEGPTAP